MPLYVPKIPLHAGEPFLAGGEAICDRRFAVGGSNPPGTGTLVLTNFVPQVTEVINSLVLYSTATASSGATLVRYCVYSINASGDLTLEASTPSDVTLLSTTFTRYPKGLSTSWTKQAGQRYAAGFLCVATTATPTTVAVSNQSAGIFDTIFAQSPMLFSSIGGQADLPASIPSASVAPSRRAPYVEMLP